MHIFLPFLGNKGIFSGPTLQTLPCIDFSVSSETVQMTARLLIKLVYGVKLLVVSSNKGTLFCLYGLALLPLTKFLHDKKDAGTLMSDSFNKNLFNFPSKIERPIRNCCTYSVKLRNQYFKLLK